MESLAQLREQITVIDTSIIAYVRERFDIVESIRLLKLAEGLPVEDPAREAELSLMYKTLAQTYALDPSFVTSLFAHIITESKRLQAKT